MCARACARGAGGATAGCHWTDSLTEALSDAYAQDGTPHDISAALQSRLAKLEHWKTTARTIGEIAGEVAAELDQPQRRKRPGVLTGLPTLDEALGPLMPGELCIVAARTGCGKTSLATQWAEHVATEGGTTLVASLEMRDAELVKRMLCSRAGIDSRDLRGGTLNRDDKARFADAILSLGPPPSRLWSPASVSLRNKCAVARHTRSAGGLSLLICE